MTTDEQKRAAAIAAAALIDESVHVIGLGTGTTAARFVEALPRALAAASLRGRVCVPTSVATAEQARGLGLTLVELDDVGEIDLTVDGAD
ncbi:MAG TPA: ribose-5-phosphate isomerase A, partial [Caulobacteraceae bacterium]|nr:ribose-5-phosphate isomerase A [Caulobacteraceae bacterium]